MMRIPLRIPRAAARSGPGRYAGGLFLLMICFGSACGPEPDVREPLRLPLQLRPKGSCGLSPVLYDASCLAAVEITMSDSRGRVLTTQCKPLDPGYSSLADLLNAASPDLSFAALSEQGSVRFRVKGVHDAGALAVESGKGICGRMDETRHWLFWGESDLVNLRRQEGYEDDIVEVDLPIDCRDCSGGCTDLGTSQCSASMPLSYCVPFSLGLSCARRCDGDDECYEGQVTCSDETQRCDPALGNPDTGNTGGFCFGCQSSLDCDLGYSCVSEPGEMTGFCAPRCPENRCLDGAMCKRVGSGLDLLGQQQSTSAAGN